MDAKQIIDEYEQLYDWEKEEVKKHINRFFDLRESVEDIVYDFERINHKIDELSSDLYDVEQGLKELNEHFIKNNYYGNKKNSIIRR